MCGITPAGAGKTLCPKCLSRRSWDHPRRCGENPTQRRTRTSEIGSPPQVRGKQNSNTSGKRHNGITPAGAGKTVAVIGTPADDADHPRRCGENFSGIAFMDLSMGSPPQVRGKQRIALFFFGICGITPAGAGKTVLELRVFSFVPGSPPQVRGKPKCGKKPPPWTRITPAGAGKTAWAARSLPPKKDHPRRCGENFHKVLYRFLCAGSPPQVRGKLWYVACLNSCIGITPAGAGKTPTFGHSVKRT